MQQLIAREAEMAAKAHTWQTSASRSFRTNRASTTLVLPEAWVMGEVPA